MEPCGEAQGRCQNCSGVGTGSASITSPASLQLIIAVRAFATLLLDCAQRTAVAAVASPTHQHYISKASPDARADDIRVMKTALKASKCCLGAVDHCFPHLPLLPSLTSTDQRLLSVAERIVERAAFYEQRLRKYLEAKDAQDLGSSVRRMSTEYCVLRITLVRWLSLYLNHVFLHCFGYPLTA